MSASASRAGSSSRLRRNIDWIVSVTAIVAIIVTLGIYTANRSNGVSTPNADTQLIPPNAHIDEYGRQIGILVGTSEAIAAKVPTLIIYQDFSAAPCATIETEYADALDALARRGEIILDYRSLFFLDGDAADGPSFRATVAAGCADIQGVYPRYRQLLFSNQTEASFSDEQLRITFANESGLSGQALLQFQACYDNRQTENFVADVARVASYNGVNSVPLYLVGQTRVDLRTIDPSEAALREAIYQLSDGE